MKRYYYDELSKLGFHSSPGFIFMVKLLDWLTSFDQKTGCFDSDKCIELGSHDFPLHHFISCCWGRPSWAEGQGFVADLLDSSKPPVIQFEKVETEKGIRLFVVIVVKSQEYYRKGKVVNKAYAFGVSILGDKFLGGEMLFHDENDLDWDKNQAYRQFLRYNS